MKARSLINQVDPFLDTYSVFKSGSDVAIFDPISLESVCLPGDEYQALIGAEGAVQRKQATEWGFYDYLCTGGEYLPALRDRLNHLHVTGTASRISGYRVVLTDKCNMRCNYCFVETNTGKPDLTRQKLIAGLDFLLEQNAGRSEILVQWFGGEPTVRFDLMRDGDRHLRASVDRYRIGKATSTVVTNGLKLTAAMLEHFIEYRYGVGVSFDGSGGFNSLNRTRLNDSVADDVILTNVEKLLSAGVHVGINITVTNSNVRFLTRIVQALFERGIRFVYVNSPIPASGEWLVDGACLADALYEARHFALRERGMLVSALDRIYQSLDAREPHSFEHLQRDGSALAALLPDGRISLSDLHWKHEDLVFEVAELRARPDLLRHGTKPLGSSSRCRRCHLLGICGGPSRNDILLTGSAEPDPQMCAFFERGLALALFDQTQLQ